MAQILNHCARRYLSTTITKNTAAQTWQSLYPPKHEGNKNYILVRFLFYIVCVFFFVNYVISMEKENFH